MRNRAPGKQEGHQHVGMKDGEDREHCLEQSASQHCDLLLWVPWVCLVGERWCAEAERDPNHPIVISLNFPLLYLNITQPLRPFSLVSGDVASHSLSLSRNTFKVSHA